MTKHYYHNQRRLASAIKVDNTNSYLAGNPSVAGSNSLGSVGSAVSSPNGSGPTSTPTSYGAMVNLDGLLQGLGLVPGTDYDLATLSEKQEIETSSSYTGVDDFRNSNSDCQGDTTCLCEADPYWAQLAGYECAQQQIMYWYHPDYLGNTELITDAAGRPYQYFLYTPWGEVLESQRQWGDFYDTRYQFNGKELDAETGNYYYGARYYDPETSIWLSVDPLAMHPKQMDKSPYAFSWNNPVRYVDPDGRCPECEDNVENPEVGETYESSGGRTYQYQNTYDEDGNKTGAAWTGLGGKLAEVEVGPGAENSGPQGGGTPGWVNNTLGAASATTGYFQAGYLNDANQTFKYGQRINGKVRSASTITRANRISSLRTARSLTRVGGGLTILAAGATVYDGVTGEAG